MSDTETTKKKGRGRPKGSPNKKKTTTEAVPAADRADVGADHNHKQPHVAKEPLDDDQLQALFFKHKAEYEKALKAKKAADAEIKLVAKRLKAEGTKLSDVKVAIALESPEGEADLRDKIERELRVARWLGLPVGTQLSLLDETDRTPSDERAFEEGKRSGLKGEPASPPRGFAGANTQHWMRGHAEGNAVLLSKGIREMTPEEKKADNEAQRKRDSAEFDKAPTNDDLDDGREAAE